MEGKIPKDKKLKDGEEPDYKKKFSDLDKKFQELKLQNTTLQNNFNKAMRVISREIGENTDIDSV